MPDTIVRQTMPGEYRRSRVQSAGIAYPRGDLGRFRTALIDLINKTVGFVTRLTLERRFPDDKRDLQITVRDMRPNMISRISATVVLACVSILPSAHAADVKWNSNVESALYEANQTGRPVLMKFTADWCGYCKKMERETFTRPEVAAVVNQYFVPVLVDADRHKPLVEKLQIEGLPAILIVSSDMVILDRIKGYKSATDLMPRINAVVAKQSQAKTPQTSIAGAQGFSPAPARPVSNQTLQPTAAVARDARPAVFDAPAFGGLCLPGVSTSRSLISGMPQLALRYRGKTLYFSSQEHQASFQANPAKYWPQQDGNCPVALVETGQIVEGKLEFAAMFRGKLWVTQDAESMKRFVAAPARYADAINKARN